MPFEIITVFLQQALLSLLLKPARTLVFGKNELPTFNASDDAFLAIELGMDGLKDCKGTVEYPKEFDACI